MEVLIPIFGIVFLFGAPVAAWIISRVLAHQERMEMIRHGYLPPPGGAPGPGNVDYYAMKAAAKAWKYGAMPPGMTYDPQFIAQQQLRRGIQVTFIGLALLIGLSFIGIRGDGSVHLGPWLLGGLIPMFVGIAQVIGAILGGARLGYAGPQSPSTFGPAAAPPPPGSPPPPEPPAGPYAWRPGPTPEIEKPTNPPDHR
jgi:hypothetical protein